jgi:hypothetical protein
MASERGVEEGGGMRGDGETRGGILRQTRQQIACARKHVFSITVEFSQNTLVGCDESGILWNFNWCLQDAIVWVD